MDTQEISIARTVRCASRWLVVSMLCAGAAACAGLEPSEEVGGDVDRLAERLVQSARERADLRQIRVWVAEIRETRPQTTRASATPDDMIGLQLEHELVIALATRLNVVESEIVEPSLDTKRVALGESATSRGATHVLVGDYVRQRDALQITVRLIDAESRLIVAAARGSVKLAEVGLMGFDRWARSPGETLAPPGRPVTVTQPKPSATEGAAASSAPATASVAQATLQPPTRQSPTLQPPTRLNPAVQPATVQSSTLKHPTTRQPATLKPPTRQAPAPVAAKASPQPAPSSTSSVTGAPIEDFESWRQRRQAEREAGASDAVAAMDQAARDSVAPAVRARRDELANPPVDEEFPWRRNPWLARLLGITETPPKR